MVIRRGGDGGSGDDGAGDGDDGGDMDGNGTLMCTSSSSSSSAAAAAAYWSGKLQSSSISLSPPEPQIILRTCVSASSVVYIAILSLEL